MVVAPPEDQEEISLAVEDQVERQVQDLEELPEEGHSSETLLLLSPKIINHCLVEHHQLG